MNKKELGIALKTELDKGYDIVRISKWAFKLFSEDPRVFNSEAREILQRLFSMQDDPQFEYTEQDLKSLSLELIKEGEKEELTSNDSHIYEKAEILDNDWLMCPHCQKAWELRNSFKFIECPNCNYKLYNPRNKELG